MIKKSKEIAVRWKTVTGSPGIILCLVLFICFWPLALGMGMLKWDAVDIYLPWKYFITESLKQGELPLWNPFTSSGFAQMGDPGTWYPVSWIIGLLGTYDFSSLHVEFLLHLYLAGVGFYALARLFSNDKYLLIILSVSYMLSGFMVGNAQHIGWIVSAAWLPFVIRQFVLFTANPCLKHASALAFFMYLLFCGGYPPVFITVVYICVAWWLIVFFKRFLNKEYFMPKTWIFYSFIAVLLFIIFSLPALIGAIDLAQNITRLSTGWNAKNWYLEGSPGMNSLITLIFPMAGSLLSTDLWNTDFSMINWYFGIIPLLLLLLYAKKGKHSNLLIFSSCALFFLLLSLGNILPLRHWIGEVLPLMNSFRFPGIFRLFFIFFALISLANISNFTPVNHTKFRFWVKSFSIIALLYLFTAVGTWIVLKDEFIAVFPWQNFIEKAGIWQRIFLQSASMFVLFLGAAFLMSKKQTTKPLLIASIAIMDMCVSVILNLNATVIANIPPTPGNLAIHELSDNKNIPEANISMKKLHALSNEKPIPQLWRNLAIFQNIPAAGGYNPYQYTQMAIAEKKGFLDSLAKFPFIFLGKAHKDSLPEFSTQSGVQITGFSNNSITLAVETDNARDLFIASNFHEGWQAKINGNPTLISRSSGFAMSVPLKEKKNQVILKFQPAWIYPAFFLSCIALLSYVFIAGFLSIKSRDGLGL